MAEIHCAVCDATITRPEDGVCPDCGVALDAVPLTEPAAVVTGDAASCPVCDAAVRPGQKVCDECGVNLAEARALLGATQQAPAAAGTPPVPPQAQATCPSCGTPRRPGAAFCRNCGEPFPKEVNIEGLLQPGEFLSARYRVERKLGGGGMGAVYLARDMNLRGKPVAVKVVLNSEDPELLRAARQEAENLLGIDHPNIVTLRDIIDKGQIPFIVMDYLEGPDWNDLYEQRVARTGEAFTSEEALLMILGVLPAFEYLHSRRPPVVYRDFKPSQVKLVTDTGGNEERHVLLDLGVAYAYEGRPVEAWGTVGYAPPEVGGVSLQPPTMDLATICRTLQGLLGIDLLRFGYGNMPPMENVPWVPEELYYLLERGTAADPRRRFQSIGDLRSQLEGVLRLIQGREGRLPRPAGAFHLPVVSRLFTGNLSRTTGHLLSLPVPSADDPAAPALEQASDMLLQGKPEDALQQIEAALNINPQSTSAHLLKTVALARMGEVERAREELGNVSQLTDTLADWSYAIVAAQIAEDSGDLESAESLYRDLIRLVPGEIPPRQKLANLLLRQQRYHEAAQLYGQIVGADPANSEAILNWADALAAIGNNEESITVLRRVGENAVRFVDAQTRMIDLLLNKAQQEPAALNLAAEAIESLQNRTHTPRYYRLVGDWWFEAYQLGRRNRLDRVNSWPLVDQPQNQAQIAARARDAYRHYLRVAPNSPDTDEIIGRIHFGISHLM
jgi:serine/threonine-protein kinase PknG